jgi:hypothetical protein
MFTSVCTTTKFLTVFGRPVEVTFHWITTPCCSAGSLTTWHSWRTYEFANVMLKSEFAVPKYHRTSRWQAQPVFIQQPGVSRMRWTAAMTRCLTDFSTINSRECQEIDCLHKHQFGLVSASTDSWVFWCELHIARGYRAVSLNSDITTRTSYTVQRAFWRWCRISFGNSITCSPGIADNIFLITFMCSTLNTVLAVCTCMFRERFLVTMRPKFQRQFCSNTAFLFTDYPSVQTQTSWSDSHLV